ncbi:MAG TPA: hypothetical protein VMV76_02905 [Dehalococcoidia bacterium]|jgi:hypothetical protein|nr:hypothetical protein [Dehalococcoidia bacterium]
MTKKSRRTKSKHRFTAARPAAGRSSRQPEPLPTKLESPARVSPPAQDSPSRYEYVIPEVKRIGIIAGAIILVLIILSFVLG